MTNEEIDTRLKNLADAIPEHFEKLNKEWPGLHRTRTDIELELLNMSAMAIFVMLGEIAKRLPQPKSTKPRASEIEVGSTVRILVGPRKGWLAVVRNIESNGGAANGCFTCTCGGETLFLTDEEIRLYPEEPWNGEPPVMGKDGKYK